MNGYTIYFLIYSVLCSITCVGFFSILLRSFLRKRTLGTLLLVLTFLSTTLAELMMGTSFFIETLAPTGTTIRLVIEFLTFTSYLFFAFNIVFIYVFGNRLFLQDNHLVSLIYIAGFAFTTAFPAGLAYKNIFTLRDPTLYQEIFMVGPQLTIIFPERSIVLLIVMLPIAVSAFLRIVIEAIKLQRGTKDPIAKKGFQFIWQGTFLWYLGYSGLFGLLWFVDILAINPIATVGIFTFKLIFADFIGFTLLYLGWIMPDWFKRRFRKKAWIAQVHMGEIHVEPKATAGSYIAPKSETKDIQVVEITES